MSGTLAPNFSSKEVIREAARSYLAQVDPESVEDLDLCFDAIYDSLGRKQEKTDDRTIQKGTEGLGFDMSFVGGTIVTLSIIVGSEILKAATKESIKHDLIPRLDAAEKRLAQLTGKPELVHAVRARIEGILKRLC